MNILLLILALVCEILYTIGVHVGGVSMLGLGLCFWIASMLVTAGPGWSWPNRQP
jgi:hypothetical protein